MRSVGCNAGARAATAEGIGAVRPASRFASCHAVTSLTAAGPLPCCPHGVAIMRTPGRLPPSSRSRSLSTLSRHAHGVQTSLRTYVQIASFGRQIQRRALKSGA